MNTVSSQAEKIKEISGVNPLKCMKCGKCSASCPAFDEMDINRISLSPMCRMKILKHWYSLNLCGNVFPVLRVWSVVQEM